MTGLWNPKRKQQIEKLRPTCSNLDQAMSYFQGIKEAVDAQPAVKEIDFLQIDVAPVAVGVAKQAELWKTEYGDALYTTSSSMLVKLQAKIGLLEEQVSAETADLEQLKFVLNIITDIQKMMQVNRKPLIHLCGYAHTHYCRMLSWTWPILWSAIEPSRGTISQWLLKRCRQP